MRKALRISALVMALTFSISAGEIQNGVFNTSPPAVAGEMQNGIVTSAANGLDGTATEMILSLLQTLLAIF